MTTQRQTKQATKRRKKQGIVGESNLPGVRTASAVQAEIAETAHTIAAMRVLLYTAMRSVREDGDTVTVEVTDNHGKRRKKQRSNPALKRIGSLDLSIRRLQRYLAGLEADLKKLRDGSSTQDMLAALEEQLSEGNE